MSKVVAYSLSAILALSLVLLPGFNRVQAQAAPVLNRIAPETVTAGGPTFTVRLQGQNFVTGAMVLLDGVPLSTARVASKKLALADIPASAIANIGSHTLQVVNPGGASTGVETLNVVAQAANLSLSLEGNAAQEDLGFAFFVEARGEGFNEETIVTVYGEAQETEVRSANRLRFVLPKKFSTEPARIPIMVRNANGNRSNIDIFFIVPAPAKLNAVEPESVEVGTEDFEIKLSGDNFKPDAKILLRQPNGQITELEITRQKEGKLEATVPGSFRSMPGQLIVRVEQDGIQSADEVIAIAPSDDPFIFTVAPIKIRQGETKETIDIIGANLGKRVVALVDGEEVNIKDSTSTTLKIVIPGDLLSTPGTHVIQVRDEDNVLSNVGTFEVVPDVTVSTAIGKQKEGFNSESCVSLDEALLRRPRRLALGPDGLLYVTDQQNHAIRVIDFNANTVCTVAGTGQAGYNDTGNPAGDPPTFSYPNGIAIDSNGTIFVTENGNNVVRRITRAGGVQVDTFAGRFNEVSDDGRQNRLNSTRIGLEGYRDGEALDAQFRLPDDIVLAPDGSLYLADALNHAIRRITRNGNEVEVETIAGNGVPGFADGEAANARFDTPTGLALSLDGGTLFVADTNNRRIRFINLATRRVESFAGSGKVGADDGPPAQASFAQPIGLAFDSDGTLYVSDMGTNLIRRVDTLGNVSTLAGGSSKKFRDGTGLRATFNRPRGLAIDRAQGILYVADYENFRVRRIDLR